MTNNDLANMVSKVIANSGYKKSYISDQLGITRQGFNKLLYKQSFSLDDANKILDVIGYELQIDISVIKKVYKK